MKNSLRLLLSLCVFGFVAASASAQAVRILVVDLAQVYDSHYKTEEQNAKLRTDEQRAQEELEKLNAQGNDLVEEYTELVEGAKNPALSESAKSKAEQDAQAKFEEIQRKQNEVQNFRGNTQRSLQQRIKNFRDILLEEISKIAVDVAKARGTNLLIDKSGPSLLGVSSVLYHDPAYDITDAVLAEINKSRPAGMPAAAAPSAPAPSVEEPAVSFPGAR
jgi:outer membrane protein